MTINEGDERAELELIRLIDERSKLAEAIKFAPREKVAEGQQLLQEMDAAIEAAEASIARVQEAAAAQEKALNARRKETIDLLPLLDKIEKEIAYNPAALKKLAETRKASLDFLRLDAEERGIPNDDH